ncbi:MAG: hypothetical protein Kow00114_14410 [Kiloniellaceae bacterium]
MDSALAAFPALPRPRGSAPRSVANLAFAEILVIWALRRYTNCRLGREARTAIIAPEFSRALGLARLEESLAAFARLADSLATAARLPQALSVVEDDRVNASEEAVLSVLAAFQHGEVAQAEALGEWCLLPAGRAAFLAGARQLAASLSEAGHVIPYELPRRRHLALDSGTDGDRPLPGVADFAGLQAGERGLVTALRLWVSAFRQQEDSLAAARRHFERQFNASTALWGDRRSGGDAGLSLHAVLRNTTLAATRPVDVRCPTCPGLSPDEARLLDAVAWLQRDIGEPAQSALADWLPPAALRLTLGPARGLAHALLAAEEILPLRDWDFAALAAAAEPGPAAAAATDPADKEEPQWQNSRTPAAPTLH